MKSARFRSALAFFHDLLAAGAAWLGAYWLRFNLDIPPDFLSSMWRTVGWVMALDALCFLRFGLYRGVWRYASLHDLRVILTAVGVAAIAWPALLLLFRPAFVVPRSAFILHPFLLVLMMGGSRLAYRAWKEGRLAALGALNAKPVLILGAGDAAVSLLKDLWVSREWRVVGLLDDNEARQSRQIMGATVLGRIDDLPAVAERLSVQHAIIAMPSAAHTVRRRIVERCRSAGVAVLTVPSFDDLMSGKVTVSQIRNVELDDLLGRDPVVLDTEGLDALLHGKTVLVTGAGGSIGAELCRQIARFNPSRLVLFELSEFALYQIEQEFRARLPGLRIECVVGDVKDRARLDQVFARFAPSVVFHAAAYKHVPLMEEANAHEAVRNNALGTWRVAQAAIAHGADKFVLVSTDKAVNPTNVMGASKRLAELLCQSLAGERTRLVMVRFGNVLGSTGSVIPKFREQIARGGPVTVTHPEITRYFMSIPEAAQLVLQAGLMGGADGKSGGEIFVLDMGEPVKIVDLARDMIRLSGFSDDDIRIVFTGLRPGEKLYEELLADNEHTLSTAHPKVRAMRALAAPDPAWVRETVAWLEGAAPQEDDAVRRQLQRLVPEYRPAG